MKKINFFQDTRKSKISGVPEMQSISQNLNKFKPMKNYLLILGIISVFLISACSQQPEPVQPTTQPTIITPAPTDQVVVETKPSIAVDEQKIKNDNVAKNEFEINPSI